MADILSRDDAVNRLAAHAEAIGQLAQDGGAFAAAVAAFESKDGDAFRWVLNRAEMLPYCDLICEWVRIKLGVLRCIELCSLPREGTLPDLQQFARAVVQLASNETQLRRIVDAVSCGDADDYRAAIAELKLEPFCHLICRWVYFIIYRRVCEVVCSPDRIRLADAASDVRAASRDVAALLENETALAAIGKAAIDLDCRTVRSRIGEAGFQPHCEVICWLICTWRCAWVCWEFCRIRPPVLAGVDAIDEARAFALAIRPFAGKPRALGDLVNAVIHRDSKAYGEIISRWGLEPYCAQVCAWVCQLVCREFCVCICPPPVLRPWFTTVGDFDIYTQIDAASGRTSASLAHTVAMPWGGGPNFAFFDELQLGGWCPSFSPTAPGAPMRYRFLVATHKTTLAANITAAQGTITVAGGVAQPTPFKVSVCVDGETGETMTVTAVAASTWTVTRGDDGTLAAAATAGAEVWIDPKPVTGALAGTELPVGQKIVPWPANVGGTAGAPTPTFVPIVVASGSATDPVAPSSGTPWVAPKHYLHPDADGWVDVDTANISGGFQKLINLDTNQIMAGGCPPLPIASPSPCFNGVGDAGGAPAGSLVSGAAEGHGIDLAIIFQATASAASIDYSNSLCKIHVNNWVEVNNLWIQQFSGPLSCCTPIDASLTLQFTVDHEEMDAGGWSLSITSCSASAPGDITPTVSSGPPHPVTLSARGGFGEVFEDTSGWTNCSYIASLTTRPGLTTGLYDRPGETNLKTFCICGHETGATGDPAPRARKRP